MALVEKLKEILPAHKVDATVVLLSLPDCKAQVVHTDYGPETLGDSVAHEHNGKMPLACLVALTDNTFLDVWPCAIRFDGSRKFKPMQIRLCAGDVLIFRGDLVHTGAACGQVANVRIHAYLDVGGNRAA